MSSLTKVLEANVKNTERTKQPGRYRLGHHLMPPVGWLNDPNGLCWFEGRYHVFFQYSPFEVKGGLKFWGHYSSEDLISWKYEGTALYPDAPCDCHGVYSGSAFVENGKMHLFYTGNVKLDGEYDYINKGRVTSTIHVESEDGVHFGIKEEVIPFEKYPENYTCHIRDPKVWKEAGKYRMVLGGRLKEDKGSVLFYQSEDMKKWEFERSLTTENTFGYMWECPDYFVLDEAKVLSVSPQGLKREEFRFQNIYQSGYFLMKEDGSVSEEDFCEWDMGFDFYAPQTFTDNKGRRILIGWMGMPDADEEYVNPTIGENWQHCLTVPRELSFYDGKIYQYPVEEIEFLRKSSIAFDEKTVPLETEKAFDLEVQTESENLEIRIGRDALLKCGDGQAAIFLSEEAGAGRTVRRAKTDKVRNVRVLADTSAVEIYLNDGETVFSTRYYPKKEQQQLEVKAERFTGRLWSLGEFVFE